jgi:hypothetical protein
LVGHVHTERDVSGAGEVSVTTPYVEELALTSKNNEGIDEIIYLTEEIDGVTVPMNLTGYEFFAQARRGKSKDADLMCDIIVVIYGSPLDGAIRLTVQDEALSDVAPGLGYYDVLTRVEGGITDNLYQAPFKVEGGVSAWLP